MDSTLLKAFEALICQKTYFVKLNWSSSNHITNFISSILPPSIFDVCFCLNRRNGRINHRSFMWQDHLLGDVYMQVFFKNLFIIYPWNHYFLTSLCGSIFCLCFCLPVSSPHINCDLPNVWDNIRKYIYFRDIYLVTTVIYVLCIIEMSS